MEEYNPFRLDGKKILVTGASSGIGRAIAVACAKMGGTVYITGCNKEKLAQTKAESASENVVIVPADITNDDEIEKLAEEVPALDGLVHCAGISNSVLCKQIKRADIEHVFSTNFTGTVLLQSALIKYKKINKNASIVFMASMAIESPALGNALYSASKAAIVSYSKVLALELAPKKVRVNCISPAMVWTDLILTGVMDKSFHEEAEKKYPLGRYGQPEDIAPLAVYLLSDGSSWMDGSTINLTGGGEGTLA